MNRGKKPKEPSYSNLPKKRRNPTPPNNRDIMPPPPSQKNTAEDVYRPQRIEDFLNSMDPLFFESVPSSVQPNTGFSGFVNETQPGFLGFAGGSSSHFASQQVQEEEEEEVEEEEVEAIPETQVWVKGKRECQNWGKDEEACLAKAWLNVSEDPYVRNAQTAGSFWKKVKFQLDSHLNRESGGTPEMCRSKWKDLKHKVSGFCGIYNVKKSNMLSGQSDEDVFKSVVALYMRKYNNKSGFPHVEACQVLRKGPKWSEVLTLEGICEESGSKRARTEGSVHVRSSGEASVHIDLNEDHLEQEEEGGNDMDDAPVHHARPVPPRRKAKGKQAAPSASTTSEEFLKMVAELKCDNEDKKRAREEKMHMQKAMMDSYMAAAEARKKREEETTRMVQSQQRQNNMDFVIRPHDHLSGPMLEMVLAQKRALCEQYGWPTP
uniref:glutathione S-transferase T2-like n=1 Tax=Erigeron canadensis TaxID=72917 RepID=UPI001CB9C431|nr:glutathione S-transferase T2-like [Erigeron canadensis]